MGLNVSGRRRGSTDPRSLPWPEDLRSKAKDLAKLRIPLLIEGEPGVGKSQFARAIHLWGYCAKGPFRRVDGARISESLAHGDLFGHVKGSYTGSIGSREGAVRRADGGTLFVDEVHMMPIPIQGLLLTLAEEGTIRPFGSDEELTANVRLIFGTNRDLHTLVQRGTFLPDLYARIQVARLRVPPLRERRSEMRAIVDAVVQSVGEKEFRGDPPGPLHVTDDAHETLRERFWRQNIRGLRASLVLGFVAADGAPLTREHIQPVAGDSDTVDLPAADPAGKQLRSKGRRYSGTDERQERESIDAALGASQGNVSRAASELGMSRSWLYQRLQAHGLDPDAYRKRGRARRPDRRG